jgi:two-component system, chemotaxis family, sensor kinase CheA
MESLLGAFRAGSHTLSPALNDLLLQGNDLLLTMATAASEGRPVDEPTALIAQLEKAVLGGADDTPAAPPAPKPEPEAPSQPQPPEPAAPINNVAVPPIQEMPAPSPSSQATAAPKVTPTKSGASGVVPTARAARATVRVRVDRLDRLLAVAGELTVGKQTDSAHLQSLQWLTSLQLQQQRAIKALSTDLQRTRLAPAQRQSLSQRLHELELTGAELSQVLRAQHEVYARHASSHALLVEELEAEVFAARLVPAATIFANIPRAVRELARSLDKQVELELVGEDTEADRKVLDALSDPLVHMVRNAVDHGLETTADRVTAGKSPTGKITVAANAEHGQIRIAVTDDGRGMDPAKIRAAAIRKGLIDEAAAAILTDEEALELIFAPGFSMSPIITDISGRGVGMDVVRSRMDELGGQVLIDSVIGRGTTITLVLPVSLMTSQVLLVEAGRHIWAIPSRSCHGLIRLDRAELHRVEGQPLLQLDGRTVPVVALADLLDLDHDTAGSMTRGHALVVGSTRPVAIVVNRLVDEREVVIKPLGPLFATHSLAAGIAPLVDGSLAVVLSVQGLLERTRRSRIRTSPGREVERTHRLLITDDSFTTRELLRSILQSAGYTVTTAVDGQDALDKLRNGGGNFDLVVTDVEMPRMDGFGLTASIRSDSDLNHLPVIIVTSLHSDEHKRQGVQAGAQAYIVKSQFDQSNLLAAVRDLLGTRV